MIEIGRDGVKGALDEGPTSMSCATRSTALFNMDRDYDDPEQFNTPQSRKTRDQALVEEREGTAESYMRTAERCGTFENLASMRCRLTSSVVSQVDRAQQTYDESKGEFLFRRTEGGNAHREGGSCGTEGDIRFGLGLGSN